MSYSEDTPVALVMRYYNRLPLASELSRGLVEHAQNTYDRDPAITGEFVAAAGLAQLAQGENRFTEAGNMTRIQKALLLTGWGEPYAERTAVSWAIDREARRVATVGSEMGCFDDSGRVNSFGESVLNQAIDPRDLDVITQFWDGELDPTALAREVVPSEIPVGFL